MVYVCSSFPSLLERFFVFVAFLRYAFCMHCIRVQCCGRKDSVEMVDDGGGGGCCAQNVHRRYRILCYTNQTIAPDTLFVANVKHRVPKLLNISSSCKLDILYSGRYRPRAKRRHIAWSIARAAERVRYLCVDFRTVRDANITVAAHAVVWRAPCERG